MSTPVSTDPFAVPPGAAPAPAPARRSASRALVVLAVAGALLVLAVVGAAGALVLGGALTAGESGEAAAPATPEPVASGGDGDRLPAEPSALPTSPLPTAAPQARNLFRPLVTSDGGDASGADGAASPAAGTAAGGTALAGGTGGTSGGTGASTSGETVYVPGPTQTLPGATVTATAPGTTVTATSTRTATQTTTASVSPYTYDVTVQSVADPGIDDAAATLEINGDTYVLSTGQVAASVFTYVGYDSGTGLVSFTFGSTMYDVPVGTELGLG